MISVIICSYNDSDYNEIIPNIQNTIDTDYEIIKIDNKDGKYNIFTAYNEGINKASGDILVFVHEDVLFHTQSWGKLLENHFLNNENIGIGGVAGSHIMNKYINKISDPLPWWSNHTITQNLYQGNRPKNQMYKIKRVKEYYNPEDKHKKEINIAIVDGLILCANKKLFNDIKFDEKTFDGFHCYDIDICMQALKNGKNNVILNDIIVEHKSLGNKNKKFYYELTKWYNKWDYMLPIQK